MNQCFPSFAAAGPGIGAQPHFATKGKQMAEEKRDYYEVLGVDRNASEDQLKHESRSEFGPDTASDALSGCAQSTRHGVRRTVWFWAPLWLSSCF